MENRWEKIIVVNDLQFETFSWKKGVIDPRGVFTIIRLWGESIWQSVDATPEDNIRKFVRDFKGYHFTTYVYQEQSYAVLWYPCKVEGLSGTQVHLYLYTGSERRYVYQTRQALDLFGTLDFCRFTLRKRYSTRKEKVVTPPANESFGNFIAQVDPGDCVLFFGQYNGMNLKEIANVENAEGDPVGLMYLDWLVGQREDPKDLWAPWSPKDTSRRRKFAIYGYPRRSLETFLKDFEGEIQEYLDQKDNGDVFVPSDGWSRGPIFKKSGWWYTNRKLEREIDQLKRFGKSKAERREWATRRSILSAGDEVDTCWDLITQWLDAIERASDLEELSEIGLRIAYQTWGSSRRINEKLLSVVREEWHTRRREVWEKQQLRDHPDLPLFRGKKQKQATITLRMQHLRRKAEKFLREVERQQTEAVRLQSRKRAPIFLLPQADEIYDHMPEDASDAVREAIQVAAMQC